jgi:hypothetical protein
MRLLSVLAADLRFALRMMRQNRIFSAVAILSLALGIGASSAMSSAGITIGRLCRGFRSGVSFR